MNQNNIIEEIRKFVEEECKKPESNYSTAYDFHFVSMVKTAKELAENFNANMEIVELSAWLHDIGSIIYGRENHHITGAEIAEKKLRELNYPEKKIKKVKFCILNHRGSKEKENQRNFLEAQIIADADAIDAFNNFSKQFLITLVHEKLHLEEAKSSIRKKIKNKYNQLSLKESKKLIKPKYDAAMLLLGD
jgi:uncharacterized protein